MADIGIANCTISKGNISGDIETIIVTTPNTADSADTVDLTTVLGSRSIVHARAWDQTTGDDVTITINTSTDVATIDASGGATNAVYVLSIDVKV